MYIVYSLNNKFKSKQDRDPIDLQCKVNITHNCT